MYFAAGTDELIKLTFSNVAVALYELSRRWRLGLFEKASVFRIDGVGDAAQAVYVTSYTGTSLEQSNAPLVEPEENIDDAITECECCGVPFAATKYIREGTHYCRECYILNFFEKIDYKIPIARSDEQQKRQRERELDEQAQKRRAARLQGNAVFGSQMSIDDLF